VLYGEPGRSVTAGIAVTAALRNVEGGSGLSEEWDRRESEQDQTELPEGCHGQSPFRRHGTGSKQDDGGEKRLARVLKARLWQSLGHLRMIVNGYE
jgi:hypothetical protein